MTEVLMSPESAGPAVHYYMIRGGTAKTNITVWETGKIDGEYIKTYGHYHVGNLPEIYHVLQGEGMILLQEREIGADGQPIDDEIKSFKAVKVKTGDKVHIPKETGHLAVNIGRVWFVTSDDSPVNFEASEKDRDPISLPGHADYEPFKKLRGAAYYIVEKNGKPEFIRNPRYKKVPEVICE